jgi:hypothetical protein
MIIMIICVRRWLFAFQSKICIPSSPICNSLKINFQAIDLFPMQFVRALYPTGFPDYLPFKKNNFLDWIWHIRIIKTDY